MKWCLDAYEKVAGCEHNLQDGDNVVVVQSEIEKKVYKTLDGFILETETTRLSNNALFYALRVFEDLPHLIDYPLVDTFIEKCGLDYIEAKKNSDIVFEFSDLFNPDARFLMTEFDLNVESFLEVEKVLSELDGKCSYKDLSFPDCIKVELDEIYFRHQEAKSRNMRYNLDLACLFADKRLDKMLNESLSHLKQEFSQNAPKQNVVTPERHEPGKTMTLRVIIKKE